MRLLLVVIDAATPAVICPAVLTGQLPVMQRLAEAGTIHDRSVTIFPSITPAATTSIITGCYPAEHGIAGASWYDKIQEEVAYYGDDFWVMAREGFGRFVQDFLLRLNGDRLKAPTMFEMIERTGRRAACLNYLVFRGIHSHRANMPALLAAVPGVRNTEGIEGPSILSLGDFVGPKMPHGHRVAEKGGLLHRFGMDDASTGAMLRDLMGQGLPDLTVAYFADNDYRSHEVGPHKAFATVENVDQLLGEAFQAAGGMEKVLQDTYVVITSDHGHCDVLADERRSVIRLDDVLSSFRQATLGRSWRNRDEIMICPNMRAAQIYVRQPSSDLVELVSSEALTDPRIDLVLWKSELTGGRPAAYTVTGAAGRVEFARGRPEPGGWIEADDAFGAVWSWRGDAAVLDFEQEGQRLWFRSYPNAFERIASALDLPQSGEVWVTAKPGCEFELPGNAAHVGGASHGALHALDSYCPAIVAGPSRVLLPRDMRTVDIAPLCMALLGVEMRYAVGDPR
jgi:type I phosphodiesterase/nucleotide pyrophosphatase